MGSVERVLVLGIVVVIVAILGITIWGAAGDEAGAVLPAADGGVVTIVPAPLDGTAAGDGAGGGGAVMPLTAEGGTSPAPVSEIERWRQLREAEARARGETVGTDPAPGALIDAPLASGPSSTTGGVPLESNVNVLPTVVTDAVATPVVPFIPAPDVAPKAAGAGTHTVVSGDSLWKIAHRAYGDANIQEHIDAILAANPQVDAENLKIGAKLTLPGKDGKDIARQPAAKQVEALKGSLYEVRKGDTLSAIARTQLGNSSKWKQIYELNRERIADPANIQVGTTLRLPAN
jgi:LysM repeat protein